MINVIIYYFLIRKESNSFSLVKFNESIINRSELSLLNMPANATEHANNKT